MVELVRQNYKTNIEKYNIIFKKIEHRLGNNVPINHVGSTAVPGMYGKNIIDILIGVKDNAEMELITNKIVDMGFIASKHNKPEDVYRFFASTEEETKSGDVHIHLAIVGTSRYNDFLILKNYLLQNKSEAKKYSEFKKNIVKNISNDRQEYKKIKSEYVTSLLNRARNESNV